MRAVVTRVTHASVTIDGTVRGSIGPGFLILLGVAHGDTEAQAVKLADKICGLRIFEDEVGKMNLGLDAVNGQLLIVSQFTLYGNCKHGRRPDFLAAARPETAVPLYEKFIALCREKGLHVETGEFGADMKVDSLNDGPLTLILDTDTL
ncbi:D-aminoacyl-tRNA deacylase [uncultured Oscillibacter sp.]|uniref:D-aminoacyl-tRNA deacylase n=1 Tax=uncultured Oscillibacter sp. TaxID=876091 RepID=UPI0025D6CA1B|nr:D-aminoacyl-tRNA deacylase [uncultured Oscillibacter sp.]